MMFSIQPVVNFEQARLSGELSSLDIERLEASFLEHMGAFQAAFADHTFRAAVDEVPDHVPSDQVVLWFDFTCGHDLVRRIASERDVETRHRILLMDQSDLQNPLHVLQGTGFGGLVTHQALQTIGQPDPPRFGLMGQGHGFYGLKALFNPDFYDQKYFDQKYFELFSSDQYALFYNRQVHALERLLLSYLSELVQI